MINVYFIYFPVKYVVCSMQVPPLTNLVPGEIIARKIIGKQKEGRSICSHLFLGIFLQMIITVS